MARVNRELLPVGKKINHDGSSLAIVKRLKAGLTGEVYEGSLILNDKKTPIHVAVKAMKTLEFPVARQFFLQESETLAFLMHLEEEANREHGLDLKIAPIYYGRGEYQENPYLVMEFIEGKEIPDLLKDLEGGKFPEKQALTIAWHLYRTLDVLHRLLRKTYIDLKFENLWWVDGLEQLKLTDFGTLEEIQSGDMQRRGVSRDLLLSAVYFCKMATGYTPNYSLGELKEFGELKKNVQIANISWGAKRELKRLLHRNPVQRPVDASDVAARLRTLVDFWSRDVDKVLEIARKFLDRAQIAYDDANTHKKPISEEGLNAAYRARSAFEIVNLRSPNVDIAYDNERLDVILRAADHLERGKNLLRGRSYTLAKQVFQEGMEWGEDSATLRRWAYLAEIGEAVSPADFEAIQDDAFIILDESFGKELWDDALEQLEKIQSTLDDHRKSIPVGLSSLFSEAHLFAEVKKADESLVNRNYQDAAEHYRLANTHLEALPEFYQKFVRDNELGDLEASAREMNKEIAIAQNETAVDTFYNHAIELVKQGQDVESLIWAEKAYRASYTLDYHLERLSEVVYVALENYKYKLAFDIARISLLCGSVIPKLIIDLALTKDFYQASESLEIPDPIQFYENVLAALESADLPSFANGCVGDLLDKAEKKANDDNDVDLYMKAAELHEKLGNVERANDFKSKAEEIDKKKSGARHAKVDELIVDANILGAFNPNPFDDTTSGKWLSYSISDIVRVLNMNEKKYQHIDEIFSRAETIAHVDKYRLDELIKSKEVLAEAFSSATASGLADIQKKQKQYEDDLFALNYWWAKIEPLFQWRERSKQVFENSDASQLIYKQLFGETRDFLAACYAVLQSEKSARFVEKSIESLAKAAQEQEAEAEQGKEPVATIERAEIRVLIENAHKVLNSLGPDAWREIKQVAETAFQNAESLLPKANRAFEEGKLSDVQALLDHARLSIGETQEWKTLYAKTMRVTLWIKWQKDNSEKFSSSQYHPDLLKMIRSYAEQKLPSQYWSGSLAEVYLKQLDAMLQSQVSAELAQHRTPTFLEPIKEWLDVSWTNRLASSMQDKKEAEWNAKEFLDDVYFSAVNKDIAKLTALIHKAPIPEQIYPALSGITPNVWTNIISREDNARRLAEANRQKNIRTIWIALAAIAVFCVTLVFAAFLFREPISVLVNGTYTPTASLTPTATPTFTATPTLSPTPTLTPTPLTPSIYLVPDPKAVYPVIPSAVEVAWLIPPDAVNADPAIADVGSWTREVSTDPRAGNQVFYSTQKAVSLFWTTDQPLPGGWYAIYVADTKSKSGGFGSQTYSVSSNGQPLLPFRGQSSVVFNMEALGQTSDEWLALGVYEISAGQKVEVKTITPALAGNASFSLGNLLIVKITAPQKALYDLLPSERVLFSLSDDTSAIVLNTENMGLINPDYQGQSVTDANLNSWGGSFRSLGVDSLKGISNKVSVQWYSAGRLPAGKYQLMAWIPANGASATGEFSMLLNGKPVDKQTLPIINQADHPGQWWVVDMWNLREEGSVNILFTVNAAENAGKFIGIDAVALVRVE